MMRLTLLAWLALATAVVAQPATQPAHRPGTKTPVVLAAQVMLDRAGFSPGEIDGQFGPNVHRALEAFQHSRRLAVTARLDPATSRKLNDEFGEEAPVVTYVVTEADVAGPFQPDIPEDLEEQSKLEALGYRNPLEKIAEQFHASPALLRSLNPGQTFMRAGEEVVVPHTKPTKGTTPKTTKDVKGTKESADESHVRIIVTKRTSALTVEDNDGRVLFHAPVTTGSNHDPLPLGMWKVTAVQRMPDFFYNPDLFWDADPTHSKARIPPGPNNPVGVAWIGINKEHYGIHGTPEPSTIAHVQSHGCVRLTNWDVERVLEWARPGTPVIFQ
jgi:lipoprotein-anchoring transpeptidase ErfK/SrfK